MILGEDAQRSHRDKKHIRRLFLEPKPQYSVAAAAQLLGIRASELRAWIDVGEVEAVETPRGLAIPWAEVVAFGMEIWSQASVEQALGSDLAAAIPELLRLTDLEVRLPRMEVVALQKVASRERRSVDAVVASELLDFVSAHAEWLEQEAPGFAAALAWPDGVVI